MNKVLIGTIFVTAGAAYGSLAIDTVYEHTLGWLVEHGWVKIPPQGSKDDLKELLGRKSAIMLYSLFMIIIGIFILWNRNI